MSKKLRQKVVLDRPNLEILHCWSALNYTHSIICININIHEDLKPINMVWILSLIIITQEGEVFRVSYRRAQLAGGQVEVNDQRSVPFLRIGISLLFITVTGL